MLSLCSTDFHFIAFDLKLVVIQQHTIVDVWGAHTRAHAFGVQWHTLLSQCIPVVTIAIQVHV